MCLCKAGRESCKLVLLTVSLAAILCLYLLAAGMPSPLLSQRRGRVGQQPLQVVNRTSSCEEGSSDCSEKRERRLPHAIMMEKRERRLPHAIMMEKRERRLPHAIMIGSKKCGTGAFLSFLQMHPELAVRGGEVHYFDWHYDHPLEWYRRQMPLSTAHQLTLEKSPRYLVTPSAPERIHHMNSSIKLLVIVRDPTKRLVSDYVHVSGRRVTARYGLVPRTFEAAVLDAATGRLNESFEPVPTGIYVRHLRRYLRLFRPGQIHVIDGEEFVKDPLPGLRRVEDFLGVRRYINESHVRFVPEKGFFCRVLHGEPQCAGKAKGRPHPTVDPQVIKKCQDFYRPYNEEFFQLTGLRFNWA